jgi:hypothetical protein
MNNLNGLIRVLTLVCLAFLPFSSQALSISYTGAIGSPGNPLGTVNGTVGGSGWVDRVAVEVDFWSFDVGPAGGTFDIWGARLDSELDLVFSLYEGTTAVDESEFLNRSDFGGMSYIDFADDEIFHSGPYGDPSLYSLFLPTGDYTIAIGGYASGGSGPYAYELTIGNPGDAPNPVPVPAAVWLFLSGLVGLFGASRKKKA